jgi:hypothetical protein
VEFKKTLIVAGVTPFTPAYAYFDVKVDTYFAIDSPSGYGVTMAIGQSGSPSTDHQAGLIEANTWYTGCDPWMNGMPYDLWSAVCAFGWNYLRIGDGTGRQGPSSGPLSPGVTVTTVSTSATTVGGTTVNVTSATGIVVGQLVTCSATSSGVATTVTNVAGSTITVSPAWAAAVAAGMAISFQNSNTVATLTTTPAFVGTGVVNVQSLTGIINGQTAMVGAALPPTVTVTATAAIAQVIIATNAATPVAANTLTFTSTTGVAIGQPVSGTHIPTATYVTAFTPTTVTLSQYITQTVTLGTNITFGAVNQVTLSGNFFSTCDLGLPISFGTPVTAGAALTYTTSNGTTGTNTVNVNSVANIAVGCVVFSGGALPDGTKVSGISSSTITFDHNFVSTLDSGKNIWFATEVFDGALWWRAFQPTPSTPYANNVGGIIVDSGDAHTITGLAYNTRYGAILEAFTASDSKLTRTVLRNFRTIGTQNAVWITGSAGGQVDCDLLNCHLQNDSGASTSNQGITIYGGITANVRMIGGRLVSSPSGSSSQGIRILGGANTVNIDLSGGAYIYGEYYSYLSDDANTGVITVNARNCTFDSGDNGIYISGGVGSVFQFGEAAQAKVVGNTAGYVLSGSYGGTVQGQLLRLDLTVAPSTTTRANINEKMYLATPTATEYGYLCTSAGATFTWHKLPLA